MDRHPEQYDRFFDNECREETNNALASAYVVQSDDDNENTVASTASDYNEPTVAATEQKLDYRFDPLTYVPQPKYKRKTRKRLKRLYAKKKKPAASTVFTSSTPTITASETTASQSTSMYHNGNMKTDMLATNSNDSAMPSVDVVQNDDADEHTDASTVTESPTVTESAPFYRQDMLDNALPTVHSVRGVDVNENIVASTESGSTPMFTESASNESASTESTTNLIEDNALATVPAIRITDSTDNIVKLSVSESAHTVTESASNASASTDSVTNALPTVSDRSVAATKPPLDVHPPRKRRTNATKKKITLWCKKKTHISSTPKITASESKSMYRQDAQMHTEMLTTNNALPTLQTVRSDDVNGPTGAATEPPLGVHPSRKTPRKRGKHGSAWSRMKKHTITSSESTSMYHLWKMKTEAVQSDDVNMNSSDPPTANRRR